MGEVAERLQIRHHSVVELVDRLEKRGFVQRRSDNSDRRLVLLSLTPAGDAVLRSLVSASLTELWTEGPALVQALSNILHKVG